MKYQELDKNQELKNSQSKISLFHGVSRTLPLMLSYSLGLKRGSFDNNLCFPYLK